MAPHVRRVRKENVLGKLLAFLSWFTNGIRYVSNYIGQLFKWDNVDAFDYTEQHGKSLLLSTASEYVDCNSLPSRTDLEDQFQQSDEVIRAKFETEIFANINQRCEKVKEFKNCCIRRVNDTFRNKEGEKNKKAVENSLTEQNDDTNKDHQAPKLLQFSGGNGSNSPTNNETAVKGNKPLSQTIGQLSHGHGTNNGGCEGDGNDPTKKNSNRFLKGHYIASAAEPLNNKDVFKCTSKLRLPLPESSGKNENGSTKIQVKTSPSLTMDTVIPSGEANNHFGNSAIHRSESSVTNGHESNATDRNESSVTGGHESNATDRIESNVTDGHESNATDRDESSVTDGHQSNATDGHQSNATDRNESSVTDGHESNATDRNESSVTGGHESNATDRNEFSGTDGHESNATGRNDSRVYNILYPFQCALSVGIYDGCYRLQRDFITLREICRGRFGVCFEVLDRRSGKTFAMKQILCKDFDANELKIWSKLTSNQNVVQLLGAYDDAEHVRIFMELMDGTLKYIADNREALCMTDRKVAAVIKPVLEVLASMHHQGYVHFDIKPDNILLDHSDIKLGDFGLTVDRKETTGNIGHRGTVSYMPKELFCGGDCGASADIYAVGCTVLHLLIGSPPWPGLVQEAIIWKVGCGETPDVPGNCSDQMKSALKCMLQPDHEERPTAKEILLYPLFSDSPDSVLDDVLQEVLVDIQLLRNQPSDDLAFSPMTLDGEDEEDEEYEGTDPALAL